MHLRSISMKGFKSFPDRTRMEFGPGVSVIVGPNGSGKSNVTDAVLWAMGEQSPLAVRGQSMQDVIFGGGRGVQARTAAEVELVLDNADGTIDLPVGEISILRRLDRSGDGEYRLNGARCRLVDVLEILSDTGLGKEMHSVVSQGRVEAIVTSRPRDRRLLIEEAAGLGKHRKRRRRAQLKLERTEANLDRALDVEREARTRLRPLKRQAEAAELHERLERQVDEARWELARDAVRARARGAEGGRARGRRRPRARATAPSARSRASAARARPPRRRWRSARSAARSSRAACGRRGRRPTASRSASSACGRPARSPRSAPSGARARLRPSRPRRRGRPRRRRLQRVADLEARDRRARRRARARAGPRARDAAGRARGVDGEVEELKAATEARRAELREADAASEAARGRAATPSATSRPPVARPPRVGSELAACNQALRLHQGAPGGARSLADELEVEAGCERALAAVLGGRLRAALVEDLAAAAAALDRAGADGGRALVVGDDDPAPAGGGAPVARRPAARRPASAGPTVRSRSRGGCSPARGSSTTSPRSRRLHRHRRHARGRVWNGGAASCGRPPRAARSASWRSATAATSSSRRPRSPSGASTRRAPPPTAQARRSPRPTGPARPPTARCATPTASAPPRRRTPAAPAGSSSSAARRRRRAPRPSAARSSRASSPPSAGSPSAPRASASCAPRRSTMLRDGAAADRALVPVAERLAAALDAVAPRDGQPRRGARGRAVRRPQRGRGRRRAPAQRAPRARRRPSASCASAARR